MATRELPNRKAGRFLLVAIRRTKKLPALDFLPKSIVSLKNRRRIYLMAT